jgi:hypothetical protein
VAWEVKVEEEEEMEEEEEIGETEEIEEVADESKCVKPERGVKFAATGSLAT